MLALTLDVSCESGIFDRDELAFTNVENLAGIVIYLVIILAAEVETERNGYIQGPIS